MSRIPYGLKMIGLVVGAFLISVVWIFLGKSSAPIAYAPQPRPAVTATIAPIVAAVPPPTERPTAEAAASTPLPTAVPVFTVTPVPAAAKPAPVAPTQSPEVLLAIIQHGRGVQPTDPRVAPFARQLDKLQAKCTEDRGKLADLTAGANKVMGDRGAKEPILDTLSGVATASEGLPSKQACTDLFTAYALMRTSGVPGAAPKR